jgi:hypothetical protein
VGNAQTPPGQVLHTALATDTAALAYSSGSVLLWQHHTGGVRHTIIDLNVSLDALHLVGRHLVAAIGGTILALATPDGS